MERGAGPGVVRSWLGGGESVGGPDEPAAAPLPAQAHGPHGQVLPLLQAGLDLVRAHRENEYRNAPITERTSTVMHHSQRERVKKRTNHRENEYRNTPITERTSKETYQSEGHRENEYRNIPIRRLLLRCLAGCRNRQVSHKS